VKSSASTISEIAIKILKIGTSKPKKALSCIFDLIKEKFRYQRKFASDANIFIPSN